MVLARLLSKNNRPKRFHPRASYKDWKRTITPTICPLPLHTCHFPYFPFPHLPSPVPSHFRPVLLITFRPGRERPRSLRRISCNARRPCPISLRNNTAKSQIKTAHANFKKWKIQLLHNKAKFGAGGLQKRSLGNSKDASTNLNESSN